MSKAGKTRGRGKPRAEEAANDKEAKEDHRVIRAVYVDNMNLLDHLSFPPTTQMGQLLQPVVEKFLPVLLPHIPTMKPSNLTVSFSVAGTPAIATTTVAEFADRGGHIFVSPTGNSFVEQILHLQDTVDKQQLRIGVLEKLLKEKPQQKALPQRATPETQRQALQQETQREDAHKEPQQDPSCCPPGERPVREGCSVDTKHDSTVKLNKAISAFAAFLQKTQQARKREQEDEDASRRNWEEQQRKAWEEQQKAWQEQQRKAWQEQQNAQKQAWEQTWKQQQQAREKRREALERGYENDAKALADTLQALGLPVVVQAC